MQEFDPMRDDVVTFSAAALDDHIVIEQYATKNKGKRFNLNEPGWSVNEVGLHEARRLYVALGDAIKEASKVERQRESIDDSRVRFYEGDDPAGFIAEMNALGISTNVEAFLPSNLDVELRAKWSLGS